ncbi:hypothetical protein B5E84_11215 [Lachnoclostridium sp. An14]|uniref:hypothetical protein n=1 Tax=Lachnoclostridium sp. An14 TaxID=1965562 RepID=UPI000B399404|nr:hypothetical protein [Lachnoclostridium sp. An14]OUQ17019.1 hypothetical protein B5E84_11215 [Lachnoclostridium sp. An14]
MAADKAGNGGMGDGNGDGKRRHRRRETAADGGNRSAAGADRLENGPRTTEEVERWRRSKSICE